MTGQCILHELLLVVIYVYLFIDVYIYSKNHWNLIQPHTRLREYCNKTSSLCSLTSFCELVNSLLQLAEQPSRDSDYLSQGIPEVSLSPPFRWLCSIWDLACLNTSKTTAIAGRKSNSQQHKNIPKTKRRIWLHIYSQTFGAFSVFMADVPVLSTHSSRFLRCSYLLIPGVSIPPRSTSMRPMITATRWCWVKGRTVWCTPGGTWATTYASPSRKSLRRTARKRNQHLLWFSLHSPLTGGHTVSTKNVVFNNNRNGETIWQRRHSLVLFGNLRERLMSVYPFHSLLVAPIKGTMSCENNRFHQGKSSKHFKHLRFSTVFIELHSRRGGGETRRVLRNSSCHVTSCFSSRSSTHVDIDTFMYLLKV